MQEIAFNDLPLYIPWVNRILSGAEHYEKTPQELQREYNLEKWKSIQDYIDCHPNCKLDDLHDTMIKGQIVGVTENREFVLQLRQEYYQRQVTCIRTVLEKYLSSGDAITELGAGYGAVILKLAKQWGDRYKYYAGEYTDNGLNAMRELAANENIKIHTGKCDFFTCSIDGNLCAGGAQYLHLTH